MRKSRVGRLETLVGLGRVELPTSPLSGVRSSQLSYRPITVKADFAIKYTQTPKSLQARMVRERIR